jgi:DNA-binding MarR family transcriptional regulator
MFLRTMEKPMTITATMKGLLYLAKNGGKTETQSSIAKGADVTYPHMTHCLFELQKIGLVTMKSMGRRTEVKITEKGRGAAESILTALKYFGGE